MRQQVTINQYSAATIVSVLTAIILLGTWVWIFQFGKIATISINQNLTLISKEEAVTLLKLPANKKQIIKRLEKHPYIESYKIEQLDLNEMRIKINEHLVIARWGQNNYLLANGKLLSAGNNAHKKINNNKLPFVQASNHETNVVALHIQEIQKYLKDIPMHLKSYTTLVPHIRKLVFKDDVIVMINDNDFSKRIARFQNIVMNYHALMKNNKINYFDLRYDYGISISGRVSSNG